MAALTLLRREIDAVLHRERLDRGGKRLHALPMRLDRLPDGTMVASGEASYMIAQGRALQWSPAGYRAPSAPSGRDAADAAFNRAGVQRGLSAGAASERGGVNFRHSGAREARARNP